MPGFESVSADAFERALADGAASPAFREQYARSSPVLYDGWNGPNFQVHRGNLTVADDFTAPGLATLIFGDLTVGGFVDLRNDGTNGFDEGGLFVVLGSVRCRIFAAHYGKCSFVDGDLVAEDLLLNGYQDSSLVVTGSLRTRFFLGDDICAEVGGGAEMEYGIGYALPLGEDAIASAIRPRHGEAASRALLAVDDPDEQGAGTLMRRVREGRPTFR